MKQLSEIKVGDTFAGADGVERILLDFLPDGTALTLTRDFVFVNEMFDPNTETDSYVSGYQFGIRAVCKLKTNILVKEIKKW